MQKQSTYTNRREASDGEYKLSKAKWFRHLIYLFWFSNRKHLNIRRVSLKHEHQNLSVLESELILQGKSSAILLFTLHLCRIGVAYEFRLRQLFHASSLHKQNTNAEVSNKTENTQTASQHCCYF